MTGARRQRSVPCLLLLCSCGLLAQTGRQSDSTPIFSAEISLVHVDVGVVSPEGRPLTGLTKNDFDVFDNNVRQDVVEFSIDKLPLDLALVLDVSSSMRLVMKQVSEGAEMAFRQLKKGDRVTLVTFDKDADVRLYYEHDLDKVRESIDLIYRTHHFGGGTDIMKGLSTAAVRLMRSREPGRRSAVIIVTDDLSPARSSTRKQVLTRLWEADAVLSGVLAKSNFARFHYRLVSAKTRELAEQTGGEAISAEDAGRVLPEVVERLRNRYSLYYRMPQDNAGKLRSVRVALTPEASQRYPGYRVLARKGYIVPAK